MTPLLHASRSRNSSPSCPSAPSLTCLMPELGIRKQMLDMYLPKARKSDKPLPVIVFIHGGGWLHGDRHTSPVRIHITCDDNGFIVRTTAFPSSQLPDFPRSRTFLTNFLHDFDHDLQRRAALTPPPSASSGSLGRTHSHQSGSSQIGLTPAAARVPAVTRDELKARVAELESTSQRLFEIASASNTEYTARRLRQAVKVEAGYQFDGGWMVRGA